MESGDTEKAEEEDAAPQQYVASYNYIASGSDQVRLTNTDDRNHKQWKNCTITGSFPFSLRFVVNQLSFTSGDALLVHAKPSSEWWWAELRGVKGYVPASYLCQSSDAEEEDDASTEDPWQDEEYFGSYSTLVRNMRASPKSSLWWTNHRFLKCFFIFVIEIISLRTKTLLKGIVHGSFWQRLHLEMLSDRSRTETYRRALLCNRVSLRNKAVMDLGCGTGILSLFCAQLAQPSVVIITAVQRAAG